METGRVLKLAAYYRLLATLSFVVGFGIVAAGFALGVWPMLEHMLNNAPQNFEESVSRAQPVMFLALTVVGILVWQFGKSFAFVRAISTAAEAGAGGSGVDREALRAEVGDVVDDRLAAADLSGGAGGSTGDDRERTASRHRSATTATAGSDTDDALGYGDGSADAGYDTGDGVAYDDTDGASDDEFDTTGTGTAETGDATSDATDVGATESGSSADDEATSAGDTAGTSGGDDPLAAGGDDGDDGDDESGDEWRPSD